MEIANCLVLRFLRGVKDKFASAFCRWAIVHCILHSLSLKLIIFLLVLVNGLGLSDSAKYAVIRIDLVLCHFCDSCV